MNKVVVEEDIAGIVGGLRAEQFRGKVVLVAGAAGFLPAYMVEALLYLNSISDCGCKVVALVRTLSKAEQRFAEYLDRPDFVLLQGDVARLPSNMPRADIIIHAASAASPKFYSTDPVGVMEANFLGMHNLLELARTWVVDSFLYFSSGEVYGQTPSDTTATKETDYGYIDVLNVRSCYAESKRAAETLGVSYWKQYGVPIKIVRPFHTYGPGMALEDGRVFADFVADVVSRRNIVIKGDGLAIRAFCYLADATSAFFLVLDKGQPGLAYNVGNPEGAISVGELADLLVGLYPDLGLEVERASNGHESGYLVSPIAKNLPDVGAVEALGWARHFSLEKGFARTISYFCESTLGCAADLDHASGFDDWKEEKKEGV